jgi:hypothetical protein
LRSLRTEQDAVVLRMREVARPLLADRLPEELRALLGSGPAVTTAVPVEKAVKYEPSPVPPPAIVATSGHASTGAAPAGELKPGLVAAAPGLPLVLSRDPALSGVVLIARPRPPRPAPDAPADKPGERLPANTNPNSSAASETKPPARPPITVRAPERAPPANISGSAERSAAGPVAILGR